VFAWRTLAEAISWSVLSVLAWKAGTNAFRSGEALVTLEPGESHTAVWGCRPRSGWENDPVSLLAVSTVDLARLQFATTSLYHFLFVPLTLGLAPLVAVMQTIWYRTRNPDWLRLTRFFGTLMLINFAIGVATGLVQEFQFGMNWSIYSKFVGDVFGAPLAIEGLAAFMLESTFLGLWIFGWDRLSPRLHLATAYAFALGSWLSAYFIIVANSWMQRPVGSTVTDGKAELTSVWELLSNRFAVWAYIHVLLVGLTTAAVVIFGVACWHFLRMRNQELFRRAAKLALIVGIPISAVNLGVGSHLGVVVTDYQPMKIAATEAQWDTCQPCAFSIFQIGGFTEQDQTPSFSIQIPKLLSVLATGSLNGEVEGMDPLQAESEAQYGKGTYRPHVRTTYWAMRIMAYLGTLVFLVLAVCGFFYRRRTLERKRWLLWAGVLTIPLPYLAALAGWVLSEVGRQPWIVQGLLKTVDANSPSVSTATIATSLGTFVVLYVALLIVDFVLMRRYAQLDPPDVGGVGDEFAAPAVSY
jgi:cytochrome bd ubiquinol oxidase subunit I